MNVHQVYCCALMKHITNAWWQKFEWGVSMYPCFCTLKTLIAGNCLRGRLSRNQIVSISCPFIHHLQNKWLLADKAGYKQRVLYAHSAAKVIWHRYLATSKLPQRRCRLLCRHFLLQWSRHNHSTRQAQQLASFQSCQLANCFPVIRRYPTQHDCKTLKLLASCIIILI